MILSSSFIHCLFYIFLIGYHLHITNGTTTTILTEVEIVPSNMPDTITMLDSTLKNTVSAVSIVK